MSADKDPKPRSLRRRLPLPSAWLRSRITSIALIVLINSAAILVALKLSDYAIGAVLSKYRGKDFELVRRMGALELFPYEGWHLQTKEGVIRRDRMGFAIDFDLLSPPEKTSDEFRIILIGGSGAQGIGASEIDTTMAQVLERMLNNRHDGRAYRVINLAMASTLSYQNFITLNRWAHPLNPDLILSYSGINDYVVPLVHNQMRDAYTHFNELNSLAITRRPSEVPPQLSWLAAYLPNIINGTAIGYAIKYSLFPNYYVDRAKQSYDDAYGRRYTDPNKFVDEVVAPRYVHAMQSIGRDFPGVPIMIVWQALHNSEMESFFGYYPNLRRDFYDRIYQQVTSSLVGPGWYLANFYAFNKNNPNPNVWIHPNDAGQDALAQYIRQKLECVFVQAPPSCLAD